MPWNANQKSDISIKYPGLLYKDDYLEIQRFLTNEALVRAVLSDFDRHVFNNCNTIDAFNDRLSQLEQAYRFDSQVVRVDSILTAVNFVTYIHAARPLNDVGAGVDHGYATHRVQWMMIAYYSANNPGKIKNQIRDLYVNLACANAYRIGTGGQIDHQTGKGYMFLWDDLVDQFFLKPPRVQNATSPEYLHSVFAEANFPRLTKIWS